MQRFQFKECCVPKEKYLGFTEDNVAIAVWRLVYIRRGEDEQDVFWSAEGDAGNPRDLFETKTEEGLARFTL